MVSKGKNWSVTINNPRVSLTDWFDAMKMQQPKFMRAQLE